MEQSLYVFLFIVCLGVLFLAQYKVRSPTDKFLLFIVSGVFFLALMVQSMNIELIVFDTNTLEYIHYRMAEHNLEFMLPMGICFICASFSLLSAFVNISFVWNRNFKNKDLKEF